jgi:quinolinate synthase
MQVWVDAALEPEGGVRLRAASDSAVTAGLAAVLVSCLSGLRPADILALEPSALLPRLGLGPAVLTRSRTAGLANLLEALQRHTRRLVTDLPQFPSLLIRADGVQPQGQFAEVQAQYLQPDSQQVQQLASLLRSKQMGVVAHFYMDPQVRAGRGRAGRCLGVCVCGGEGVQRAGDGSHDKWWG